MTKTTNVADAADGWRKITMNLDLSLGGSGYQVGYLELDVSSILSQTQIAELEKEARRLMLRALRLTADAMFPPGYGAAEDWEDAE